MTHRIGDGNSSMYRHEMYRRKMHRMYKRKKNYIYIYIYNKCCAYERRVNLKATTHIYMNNTR